jgi:hypothetical protein
MKGASRAETRNVTSFEKVTRSLALFTVWSFLIWLGFTAIDSGDRTILSAYVVLTAFGVAALLNWLWTRRRSN